MKIDPLALFIGGLGLIFLAMKILEFSVKALTTSHVRTLVKKHTSNNFYAALWGITLGFITNNPIVVASLTVSLLYARALSQEKSLVITTWSNLGALGLIFIAFLNIDALVLYMVGITGLAVFLGYPQRFKFHILAVCSIFLMLLGVIFMKSQGGDIGENPWITEHINEIQSAYFSAYILAILFTVLQGDLVTMLLIASLSSANVLSNDQAILMLYGTIVGNAFGNAFFLLAVKGAFKQLVIFETLYFLIPGIIFPLLLVIEKLTHIPLLLALSYSLTSTIWYQMLFILVFVNLVTCLFVTIFAKPCCAFLNAFFSAKEEDNPALPKYISSSSVADPISALDLMEQELLDLLKRIPQNIEYKIVHSDDKVELVFQHKHEAFESVMKEVYNFLRELSTQQVSADTTDRCLVIGDRIQILESLEEGIYHLTTFDLNQFNEESLKVFTLQTFEAQQALLESIIEAISSKDHEDIVAIVRATANIKPALEQVRQSYIKEEEHASPKVKLLLLTITNLYERNVWLMRRFVNQFLPKNLITEEKI